MTNGNGEEWKEDDFVNEEFKRTKTRAPRLQFSKKFWDGKSDAEKIEYLIKLASSYHHSAITLQKANDEMNKLLFEKESLIEKLQKQSVIDRNMIHQQLERENKKQQELLEENIRLRDEIKMLGG